MKAKRFGQKTAEGQKAVAAHQAFYEKVWTGRRIDSGMIVNGIPAKGEIVKVEYVGNSFSGSVICTLDNGCEVYVSEQGKYRPTKDAINYL